MITGLRVSLTQLSVAHELNSTSWPVSSRGTVTMPFVCSISPLWKTQCVNTRMMVSAGLCHLGPNHYVSLAHRGHALCHLFIRPFQSLDRPLNAQPHGFQFYSVFCLGWSSSFRLLASSLLGTKRHIASGVPCDTINDLCHFVFFHLSSGTITAFNIYRTC